MTVTTITRTKVRMRSARETVSLFFPFARRPTEQTYTRQTLPQRAFRQAD
jgi:hypothetical protein